MHTERYKKTISTVDQLIEAAVEEGADVERLRAIRGTELWEGLTEREFAERHVALCEEIKRSIQKPGFFLRAAERVRVEHVGMLGLAMKTAPTLASAWHRGARYYCVWAKKKSIELQSVGDRLRLVYTGRMPTVPPFTDATEYNIAVMLYTSRDACGHAFCPVAVYFRHAVSPNSAELERVLGVVPRMGHAFDGIEIDAATAALPMRLADEGLSRFILSQIEELKGSNPSPPSPDDEDLRGQVSRLVGDKLAEGAPAMPEVGRALGMSARTLRRRLSELGVTFADLVEQTRQERARKLVVDSDYSAQEIAFLTGFSEAAAFYRAFKRWTGMTPNQFRASMGGTGPLPMVP